MNLKLPFEINFVQRLKKVIADEKVAFKIQSKLQFSRWFRCVARRLSAEKNVFLWKNVFCEKFFSFENFQRNRPFSKFKGGQSSKCIRGGPWDGSKSLRRRCWHVKAFACNFQMAQNSNSIKCQNFELAHFFQLENPEMAQNSNRFFLESIFSSNFEPSRSFRAKKSEPSQGFDTWWIFRAEIKEKLNSSNFEPSQSYMHMPSRVKTSFDDFLSHLKVPPVRKCWFSTKKFSKSPMQMRLYVNLLQC